MTEWVEQQNLHQILCEAWTVFCGNYSDDSEVHAMGNWWLAASQQCTHSCIMSHVEFSGETPNHPGNSTPLQLRFGTLWIMAFPKIKTAFEREEISDHWWDSGKCDGAADGDWENCVRSQAAYFEGDWGIIVLCTMFLVSCILFSQCLYFSYDVAEYFLDRSHMDGERYG